MSDYQILAVMVTFLQIADGWLTYQVLKNGGRELWKPMIWLMERLGVYWALVVGKGIGIVAAWALVYAPMGNDIRWWSLAGLTFLYAAVFLNNVNAYMKGKT